MSNIEACSSNAIHAVDSSIVFGHSGCSYKGMSQILIPFMLAGVALVLLVGGVLIFVHGLKTLINDRNLRSK